MLKEGKIKNLKLRIMANYATNLFFATTENEQDLDKIEVFLNDNLVTVILNVLMTLWRASFLLVGLIQRN